MSNSYKLYQMSAFFTIKFNYKNILIKGYKLTDEVFLFNKDNQHFKLIHITMKPLNDKGIDLNEFKESLSKQFNISDFNYLDIHICREDVSLSNDLFTICIDEGYYSGVDYSAAFPGIKTAICRVKDDKKEEKSRIKQINSHFYRNYVKSFYSNLLESKVTFIIGIICIAVYIGYLILKAMGYTSEAIYVFLGCDYKTFTLGLNEFYRLITCGFIHGSFFHLFCNMYSLFILGPYIERKYGALKYLFLIIGSILCGSLCQGCLTTNSICLGLSAGLYSLMVIYILSILDMTNMKLTNGLLYIVFLNLLINFMPGVAWQAHLGGAIFGLVFYYIFKEEKISYIYLLVSILLIVVLGIKYISNDKIEPLYMGTDSEVLSIYDKLHLKNKYNKTKVKLIELYIKEGAIYYE